MGDTYVMAQKESVLDTQGVFLVKTKSAFIPAKRVYSVNVYSQISNIPQGSERVSERARERSERAKQA